MARNMLAWGQNWINSQLQGHASDTVSYTRVVNGSPVVTSISATVGRTVFSTMQEGGPTIEFGERDYLIPATELPYSEPQKGDRITVTLNGATEVYEVMPPNANEPAWRWSDAQHTMFRLHMKRVS
jgi:hypothetical protein